MSTPDDAGCCEEIGPLLVAPGTSGRSWACGTCGRVWMPSPEACEAVVMEPGRSWE